MVDSGNTAFILICSALAFFMVFGIAFFYCGMIRRKNALSILMQSICVIFTVSLQWVLFGYTLAFAPSEGFAGDLRWLFTHGITLVPCEYYAKGIPHQLFMIFYVMFAITAPVLITGGFAERIKFSAFFIFIILWSTFVYDPVCHWVWSKNGWLKSLGLIDFAGAAVVHINAGISALASVLVIGKRNILKGSFPKPHNLPYVIIGAAITWFGWLGFNSGSALEANKIAVNAFLSTHIAAISGGITWCFIEWALDKKPTILGVASGIICGLAAITASAGHAGIISALLIGSISSVLCFLSVGILKRKLGYDDSLDAFGINCVAGVVGVVSAGLIPLNPSLCSFSGVLHQVAIQLVGAIVVLIYGFCSTFIIFKIIDIFIGVRVTSKDEALGLDLSQHHEQAYTVFE